MDGARRRFEPTLASLPRLIRIRSALAGLRLICPTTTRDVAHTMMGQVIANQAPHHLRRRHVLLRAKCLEGLFLGRINEDRKTSSLELHDDSKYVNCMLIKHTYKSIWIGAAFGRVRRVWAVLEDDVLRRLC